MRPCFHLPGQGLEQILEQILGTGQAGIFVLELQAFWIVIEIALEIGKLPEIDFDHDFNFDECWPTRGWARREAWDKFWDKPWGES